MRTLSDFGANRILEIATRIGLSNFKGAPLIVVLVDRTGPTIQRTELDRNFTNFFRIDKKWSFGIPTSFGSINPRNCQ